MATPTTLPSTPDAVPGNLLPDMHGTGFSHSEGTNEMIDDIYNAWVKIGTGSSSPVANSLLGGTGTGTSAWSTGPTISGTLTAGGLTISGNGVITPGTLSGTPVANSIYQGNVCKMWCHYTSVTTTAVVASHNVTSVTDQGTGLTDITIDRDFAGSGFALVATPDTGAAVAVMTSRAAGVVRIQTLNSSFSAVDVVTNVVSFGAQ